MDVDDPPLSNLPIAPADEQTTDEHTPDRSPPGNASSPDPRRRKNVTTACDACRARRIKCDDSKRCRRCTRLGITCHRRGDTDGRKAARVGIDDDTKSVALKECLHLLCGDNQSKIDRIWTYLHGEPQTPQAIRSYLQTIFNTISPLSGAAPISASTRSVTSQQQQWYVLRPSNAAESSKVSSAIAPLGRTSFELRPFHETVPSSTSSSSPSEPFNSRLSSLLSRDQTRTGDDQMPGFAHYFGYMPFPITLYANGYPLEVHHTQMMGFALPVHAMQPLIDIKQTCRMGITFLKFRDACRERIRLGEPPRDVLGHYEPCVDLTLRTRRANDPMSVDMWAGEFLRTFESFEEDTPMFRFVKIACVYLVGRLARWMVYPTAETYAEMPVIIRPLDAQRLVPHDAAIDTFVLSPVRACLREKAGADKYISLVVEGHLRPLWHGTFEEALVQSPSGHTFLSSDFKELISSLSGWAVDQDLLDGIPALRNIVDAEPVELPASQMSPID